MLMARYVALTLLLVLAGSAQPFGMYAQEPGAGAPDEVEDAVRLYRRGDNAAAAEALRGVVKRRKDSAEAWHYLGLALRPTPDLHGARKAFEAAIKLRPDFAPTHAALAEHLYTVFRRLPEARSAAERALALDPTNHLANYVLGAVLLTDGSNREALERANSSLKSHAQYPPALKIKAIALLELYAAGAAPDEPHASRHWMLREAAQSLEEYLRLHPGDIRRLDWESTVKAIRDFLSAVNSVAGPPRGSNFWI